jgi:hypothetical protein
MVEGIKQTELDLSVSGLMLSVTHVFFSFCLNGIELIRLRICTVPFYAELPTITKPPRIWRVISTPGAQMGWGAMIWTAEKEDT